MANLIQTGGGSGGGGTPGGANTNVQFNDSGSFGGNGKFVYSKVPGALILTGVTDPIESVTIGDDTTSLATGFPSLINIVATGSDYITLSNSAAPANITEIGNDASGNFYIVQGTNNFLVATYAGGFQIQTPGATSQFQADAVGNMTIRSTTELSFVSPISNISGAFVAGTAGTVTVGGGSRDGDIGFVGKTSGQVDIKVQDAAGTYNFNLPITAGSPGQVLTSQGGGTNAMTWSTASAGSVTSFSAGNLSPLFTTSVATPTTTPALTFSLSNAGGGTVFGNNTTGAAAPAFTIAPVLGIPGTSTGTIALASSTASGLYTITAPANAATPTLTLPTGSGTFAVSASAPLVLNATTGNLTFTAAGAVLWNQIGNAAADLTLANAGFNSTFNQTSAVNWTWANTTAATNVLSQSSPIFNLNGTYWTGAASATDSWTIQNIANSNGANGVSALSIGHSGTTGQACIITPSGSAGKPSLCIGTKGTGFWQTSTTVVDLQWTATNGGAGALNFYSGTTPELTIGVDGSNNSRLVSQPANSTITVAGQVTTAAACGVNLSGNGSNNGNFTGTTGTQTAVGIGVTQNGIGSVTFAPTSGTATFVGLNVNPTINQTGSASGSYVAIQASVVETALLGTTNSLLQLNAGVSGTTTQFAITNKGIVSVAAGLTTVKNGVGVEVATSDLTAQAAAIAATTIYAVPAGGAGLYRISYVASITTAATTSCSLGGTNGFQAKFTNKSDSVVKTSNPTTPTLSATNATSTTISGTLHANCAASTNLQYLFDYSSVGGTAMQYDLSIRVEYLG